MSYKRKTCECCRKRLDWRFEDYWCVDCRAKITTSYWDTMAEFDQWRKEGVTPVEGFCRLLDRVTGQTSDREQMERELMETIEAKGSA